MDRFKDQEGTVIHSLGCRTLARYGDLVVKSGDIRPHEADTLRFISAKTTIPAMWLPLSTGNTLAGTPSIGSTCRP